MPPDDPENHGTHEHADHDEHPEGSELPPAQEDRIVDKVVSKIKEIVGPAGASSGETPSAPPAGPAATERDMEDQVRRGVEKEITARERKNAAAEARRLHDEEHERMRSLVETPPKVYSKLTTALWGSDDE